MSKIDAQIQDLLLKKKKVELLKLLVSQVAPQDMPDGLVNDDPYKEVRPEITGLVKSFVDAQIEMIEESKQTGDLKEQLEFSQDEIKVLKEMVNKLVSKAPVKQAVNQNVFGDGSDNEPKDPLSFAQKYRHLDSKRVRFSTKDGDVNGKVVGLEVPNITVKTDTGYTVQVPPSSIQVIQQE